MFVNGAANDLLGITHNRKIRIMGDYDDLPPFLRFLNAGDQKFVDGLVIEILLRLVNDQWSIVLIY
jgi:hypothetical protein